MAGRKFDKWPDLPLPSKFSAFTTLGLKMETARSSETLSLTSNSIWHQNSEERRQILCYDLWRNFHSVKLSFNSYIGLKTFIFAGLMHPLRKETLLYDATAMSIIRSTLKAVFLFNIIVTFCDTYGQIFRLYYFSNCIEFSQCFI
jgi:hypothetical protein